MKLFPPTPNERGSRTLPPAQEVYGLCRGRIRRGRGVLPDSAPGQVQTPGQSLVFVVFGSCWISVFWVRWTRGRALSS